MPRKLTRKERILLDLKFIGRRLKRLLTGLPSETARLIGRGVYLGTSRTDTEVVEVVQSALADVDRGVETSFAPDEGQPQR